MKWLSEKPWPWLKAITALAGTLCQECKGDKVDRFGDTCWVCRGSGNKREVKP